MARSKRPIPTISPSLPAKQHCFYCDEQAPSPQKSPDPPQKPKKGICHHHGVDPGVLPSFSFSSLNLTGVLPLASSTWRTRFTMKLETPPNHGPNMDVPISYTALSPKPPFPVMSSKTTRFPSQRLQPHFIQALILILARQK